MTMRPLQARWFELLTTRDEVGRAVEALATTGTVEPEIQYGMREVLSLQNLQRRLDEFNRLAQRYQPYWPDPDPGSATLQGYPGRQLDAALHNLRAWEAGARPLILRLEALAGERHELRLLADMLGHLHDETLDIGLLARSGNCITARVFVLPADADPRVDPDGLLTEHVSSDRHEFLVAVGLPRDLERLGGELAAFKPAMLHFSPLLQGTRGQAQQQIEQRCSVIDRESDRLHDAIAALSIPYHLPEALATIFRLDWLVTNMSTYPVSENFAWITGWTCDLEDRQMSDALQAAGVRAVLHFPAPPDGVEVPMVIRNPWWAQPFELFARMLGTPSRNEVEPSRILALLVPLLFGYMFGDVGQGLVLVLAGFYLQRRWPFLRLLVANGLSAMVFGVVFGSVFGREDLIPALWVYPVVEPLPVLIAPLFGGILILLAGLAMNALEAGWRGKFSEWLRVDAAVLVLYLSIIAGFFLPGMMPVAVVALLWYFTGCLLESETGFWRTLAGAAGALVENVLQLLINTVSFVRVGAFALAHAGLSLAFYVMADATGTVTGAFLVMLLGNVIVILLEGLVVTIQTTRLILFEFFIRFLRASGRMFRPLDAPAAVHETRRLT